MTINHRAEAVRLAEESHSILRPNDEGYCEADRLLAEAQVHATLARDEADSASQANARDALTLLRRREYTTRNLLAEHLAKGLASKSKDRWQAARDLARGLDEADTNLDREIDAQLADLGYDTKTAWDGGTITQYVDRADNPWAPIPDITNDVPEPVRGSLAQHLAEMLLVPGDDGTHHWARHIAFGLKNEGVDLTDAIKARIHDMTLGRDPSEPPF